jgi:hypothetical protein
MNSEINNVLDPAKRLAINEAIRLPADECVSCNENGSEKAGIEPGYLCRSCWAAAHTAVKFVLEV